jgi:hypothetical protein
VNPGRTARSEIAVTARFESPTTLTILPELRV